MPVLLRPNRSLGFGLVLSVVVFNLFVVLLLVSNLYQTREQYELDARVSTQNLALLVDQSVSEMTKKIDLSLLGIVDELERTLRQKGRLEPDEVEDAMLLRRSRWIGDIAEFRVVDATGRVILGPGVSGSAPAFYTDRDFFRAHAASADLGLLVTDPIVGRINKVWSVVFNRRYNWPDGRFAGVIAASVPVQQFQRLLSGLDVGPTGVALLRGQGTGLVAKHPNGGTINEQVGAKRYSKELADILASGVAAQTFHTLQSGDNFERTNSYRRLSALPFHLVVGKGTDDYLATWRRSVIEAVGLAVGFLALTIIFALLLWRSYHVAGLASERSRAIIDASPVPYAVSNAQGQIVFLNRAFIKAFGYTREVIPTIDDWWLRALPDPTYRSAVQAEWRQRLDHAKARSELSVPMEVEVCCRNADLRSVLVTRAFLDGTGSGDSLVTLFDITELKLAEHRRISLEGQLRESQKMQAIGTLAGGIAHDFNNIIAVVLGNVQLLLLDAAADPRMVASLDEIRKAGRRARDLVQQILSFSRRQVVELKPTSLLPVMNECEQMLRAILPARVELELHCELTTPPAIADANQVQQIVINLATNAMQAMQGRPGHVHIDLDAQVIDADWRASHPMADDWLEPGLTSAVRLTVRDDGQGMDAQTRARIFEPFFTTKSTGEGTGLGLSVVHGIVQTHKGAIRVQSEPGQGTTFTIYLPAAQVGQGLAPVDGDPEPVNDRADVGAGRHILYIDDDESLAFLVRRLLTRRGFKVECQTDPLVAVQILRADPNAFDLVVTDYNMPGMSGIDVVHEVRAINPELEVAVISGFIDEELRSLASQAGVQQLIFKASAVEDLCEVIVRILEPEPTRRATT